MVTMPTTAAVIREELEPPRMIDDVIALGSPGHALAMQLLGNRDDAADAVQDAMEGALTKGDSFDPQRGSLKTWFLRIVRNRCIDELRRRSRSSRRASDIDPTDVAAVDDPATDSELNQAKKTLQHHLDTLDAEQREILILRDYLGLAYADIAVILTVPRGTVMSRLHRARQRLSEKMNP